MQNDRDTKEALDRWSDSNPNHVLDPEMMTVNRTPAAQDFPAERFGFTTHAVAFDVSDLVAPFAVWERTVRQPHGLAGWKIVITWGQVIEDKTLIGTVLTDGEIVGRFKFYPISNDHVELLKLTIMHGMRKLKVTQLYYDILEGRTP